MIIRFSAPEFTLQALTVRFLPDGKIQVKFGRERHIHYTMHAGTASGTIDLHKTSEQIPNADPWRYEILAMIPKAAIEQQKNGNGVVAL